MQFRESNENTQTTSAGQLKESNCFTTTCWLWNRFAVKSKHIAFVTMPEKIPISWINTNRWHEPEGWRKRTKFQILPTYDLSSLIEYWHCSAVLTTWITWLRRNWCGVIGCGRLIIGSRNCSLSDFSSFPCGWFSFFELNNHSTPLYRAYPDATPAAIIATAAVALRFVSLLLSFFSSSSLSLMSVEKKI